MSEFLTAQQELAELAELYREADEAEREAKSTKEKLRQPIFDLISEIVREEVPLARKSVRIERDVMSDVYEDDFEKWRLHHYPTWVIVNIESNADNYNITIEEDPAYVKFEFQVGNFRIGRTISTPTPVFDAERFVQDNPELYYLVDEEVKVVYTLNDVKASKYMADHPESKRIFERYIKVGSPNVKMLPIKQIEEE
jgi:hypothetical protein